MVLDGMTNATVLYKTSKQGNTIMAAPKLTELQAVADDMNVYVHYGRQLANAINNDINGIPIFALGEFSLPHKPHEPHKLDYTSDPRPLPKDHRAE